MLRQLLVEWSERHPECKILYHSSPKVLYQNRWKKKIESNPSNSCSLGVRLWNGGNGWSIYFCDMSLFVLFVTALHRSRTVDKWTEVSSAKLQLAFVRKQRCVDKKAPRTHGENVPFRDSFFENMPSYTENSMESFKNHRNFTGHTTVISWWYISFN